MKLFVAGCSVSDYSLVDKVYGEYLAENLNCEYVHEGAGAGSNWRIWRVITNHILNGNLTSDDLLIVQYTGAERREFWSRHLIENKKTDKLTSKQKLREYYSGGNIIKFKIDAHKWQPIKEEKKIFKLYENNFLNDDFIIDVFHTQNIMFQSLLKEYKISTIFFNVYSHQYLNKNKCLSFFKNNYFNIDNIKMGQPNEYLLPNDNYHYSKKGHIYVANELYDFIKNKKII